MRNEICKTCRYKRGICALFPCKVYKEAQIKRAGRRIENKFGDNFNAEDRYETGLIFFAALAVMVLLVMLLCTIKVIGDWWTK